MFSVGVQFYDCLILILLIYDRLSFTTLRYLICDPTMKFCGNEEDRLAT